MVDMTYLWYVNGSLVPASKRVRTLADVVSGEGTYTVYVRARDAALNQSDRSDEWTWTVIKAATAGDIDFGGGVKVAVDSTTGETNSVSFTAIDFTPGEACTFTMDEFEASGSAISGLQMWFVVCDTLGGETRRVKVNENATYNSMTKELTVTLPATATANKTSFFILGIDNKGSDNPVD